MKVFFLTLGLSLFLFAGFSRYTGIVTDSTTFLQWQDDYSDNYMGSIRMSGTLYGAIEYCEDLTLGGKIDWRLPNIKELVSIVDYDRHNPAISPIFQNNASNDYSDYWSSTSEASGISAAYVVGFDNGTVILSMKGIAGLQSVRCVRGGQ